MWPVAPTGYLIPPASVDGWAYTLAAAGPAADTDQPILLTELNQLPAETDQATCTAGDPAPTRLLTPTTSTSPTIAEALSSP